MDGFSFVGCVCAAAMLFSFGRDPVVRVPLQVQDARAVVVDHDFAQHVDPVRDKVNKKYGRRARDQFDIMAAEYVKVYGAGSHINPYITKEMAMILQWCENPDINVDHMLKFSSGEEEGFFSWVACGSKELKESIQDFDRILEK